MRRWRTEIAVVLAVLLAVVAFLVETLHGTDCGTYSDEINDMTMQCRARAKTHPQQDCGRCCVERMPADMKVNPSGRDGLFGCTCYAR